jgi:superfamily I DNA/RNA helicase
MTFVLVGKSTINLRFNELIPFWKQLLVDSGLPNYEASSHWQAQRLFDALEKSIVFRNDARSWLVSITLSLKLDNLLESYTHLDDKVEYERFREALEPGNPLTNSTLQDLQSRIMLNNRVYVGTIHSRKGQESKVAILAGAEDFQRSSRNGRYYSTDEQRRLFYVAVTRAREEVYVTHNGKSLLGPYASSGKPET